MGVRIAEIESDKLSELLQKTPATAWTIVLWRIKIFVSGRNAESRGCARIDLQ